MTRGKRGPYEKPRRAADATRQIPVPDLDPDRTERVATPATPAEVRRPPAPPARETKVYRPDAGSPVMGVLIPLTGHALGEVFAVGDGESTLGSGDGASIRIDSEFISARQLRILHKNGDFAIEPLGGPNPVHLNGVELGHGEPLRDGDLLEVADTKLSFRTATLPKT